MPSSSSRVSFSSTSSCCQECSRQWKLLDLEKKHFALNQQMFKEEKKNFKKNAKLFRSGHHVPDGSSTDTRCFQLEQEIESLKGDIQKNQQQKEDIERRLARVTNQGDPSVDTLKEQIANLNQDLQLSQRALASVVVERDDYKKLKESMEADLTNTKTKIQQALQEKDVAVKALSDLTATSLCSTCERHKLQIVSLDEALDCTHNAMSATSLQHTEEGQRWQEEKYVVKAAGDHANGVSRESQDQNLKDLLEKYKEETEILRAENRLLQRSLMSTKNTHDENAREQQNVAVAAAIAAKEDEFHLHMLEWQREQRRLEEQIAQQKCDWRKEKEEWEARLSVTEQTRVKEMCITQSQHQIEIDSLIQQLTGLQTTSRTEKEKSEESLHECRAMEEKFRRMKEEWDQERQSFERELLKAQLLVSKQKETEDSLNGLTEQILLQQQNWQEQKESLEMELQKQRKQMEDWKLLMPRNKALLEQSQSRIDHLKTQLEEERAQKLEQSVMVVNLRAEKDTLEQELEQYRINNDTMQYKTNGSISSMDQVLIPSYLSTESLMKLNMTKKHVVEWKWVNPNGLIGMFTGWLDLDGIPDGHGTFRDKDGGVYIGQWSKGRKTGYGVFTSVDCAVYSGSWENDKFHGRGVFVSEANQIYTGDWVNGLREGKGIESWESGAIYVGDYSEDKRNGQGSYTYPDGRRFDGEYRDDQPYGNGTQTASDGADPDDGSWSVGAFIGS